MLILWHLLHGFCGAPASHFSYKLNKKNPFGLIGSGYFFQFRFYLPHDDEYTKYIY